MLGGCGSAKGRAVGRDLREDEEAMGYVLY